MKILNGKTLQYRSKYLFLEFYLCLFETSQYQPGFIGARVNSDKTHWWEDQEGTNKG